MRVISVFDGIACGRVALDRVGIKVDAYLSCEIDKNAMAVVADNYPDIVQLGDIRKVDFTKYRGYDLLLGGSPCTHWSIAQHNNRELYCSGQGYDLFMEYVRALRESGCRWFIYENNNSISPAIKKEISRVLGVDGITINSALVSAQQRNRCYWTNIPIRGLPRDKKIVVKDILCDNVADEFQIREDNCKYTDRNTEPINNGYISLLGDWVSVVKEGCRYSTVPIQLGHIATANSQGNRVYSIYGKSVCLQSQSGGGGAKTGIYRIDKENGYILRILTPVECERLQTLPDNYTKAISKTNRYRAIGNGWTVDVIAWILSFIREESQK